MDDIEITVDTKAFENSLTSLDDKVAKRYVRKALQAGGDVVLASMKGLAPVRTDEQTPDEDSLPPGILQEDLTTQVTVSTTSGARVKIGPTEIAAHVARWIENGWMLTSHGGKKIKQIPGKHFMAAAMDEAGQSAVDAMVQSLSDDLASDTLNTNGEES